MVRLGGAAVGRDDVEARRCRRRGQGWRRRRRAVSCGARAMPMDGAVERQWRRCKGEHKVVVFSDHRRRRSGHYPCHGRIINWGGRERRVWWCGGRRGRSRRGVGRRDRSRRGVGRRGAGHGRGGRRCRGGRSGSQRRSNAGEARATPGHPPAARGPLAVVSSVARELKDSKEKEGHIFDCHDSNLLICSVMVELRADNVL
ncbi:hypothetical protein BRADI_4g01706v3 [Brachypodium distachyon]|uniref:Uncharacterized protein n=1 Tax=Brachypodium distachyon TaxID=15368 RepID=A0A0Q3L0H7_BRADI|nr:hypothetical protein BRADI_4g01706v3 [Brachypodium distachyon]